VTIVTDLQTNGALNKREAEVERAWGAAFKVRSLGKWRKLLALELAISRCEAGLLRTK